MIDDQGVETRQRQQFRGNRAAKMQPAAETAFACQHALLEFVFAIQIDPPGYELHWSITYRWEP